MKATTAVWILWEIYRSLVVENVCCLTRKRKLHCQPRHHLSGRRSIPRRHSLNSDLRLLGLPFDEMNESIVESSINFLNKKRGELMSFLHASSRRIRRLTVAFRSLRADQAVSMKKADEDGPALKADTGA